MYRDLAGLKAFAIGMDGLRRHRQHSSGETGAERGLDEGTPIERNVRDQAVGFGFQHGALLAERLDATGYASPASCCRCILSQRVQRLAYIAPGPAAAWCAAASARRYRAPSARSRAAPRYAAGTATCT